MRLLLLLGGVFMVLVLLWSAATCGAVPVVLLVLCLIARASLGWSRYHNDHTVMAVADPSLRRNACVKVIGCIH